MELMGLHTAFAALRGETINHVYHPLLLQLPCPLGNKQIPGMQSSALFVLILIPCPSSSESSQTQKRGRQVGMCTHLVSRRINAWREQGTWVFYLYVVHPKTGQ